MIKMTPMRRAAISRIKQEVNEPKDRLMAAVRRLDEAGAHRHAISLDRIVARLEAWQNRS